MRITYVGGDTAGAGTENITDLQSGSNPPTWPPGVQPLDLALLVWDYVNTAIPTTPAGFSLIDARTNGSNAAGLYAKICNGSESGTFSMSLGAVQSRQAAALAVYRHTHKSAPFQPSDLTAALEVSPTKLSHVPASGTLGVSDCGVVLFIAERASPPSTGFTPPSGYTLRQGVALTGTGASAVAVADDGLATNRKAGTVVSFSSGTGDWDGTTAQQNDIMWTVLIRPREYEGWGVEL